MSNSVRPQPGFSSSHETILTRAILNSSAQSSLQNQIDGLVGSFISQATEWKSLAALTVGGLAYRWGRIGVMSSPLASRLGHVAAMPLRALSVAVGLGSEVTAYEFTHRVLQTIYPSPVTRHLSPNLWSWSGPGGWKEGWLSSFITFGTLKGFGRLAEGQNIILQHGVQDLGMLAGHHFVYRMGLGEKPQGTLADQLVHAEATNLQLGAGMALGHSVTNGRLMALEKGLDLTLRSREIAPSPASSKQYPLGSHLVLAGNGRKEVLSPSIFAMSTENLGSAQDKTKIPETVLRGAETKKKARFIAVGADIDPSTRSDMNMPKELAVRQRGIENKEDIEYAIDYLSYLHPVFKKLFDEIRAHHIPIRLGPEDLTYSYMTASFHGAVDRSSPDFGREIVIQLGATPDVLLHEVFHALPLEVLRRLMDLRLHLDENYFSIPQNLPRVDPTERFYQLREAILENIRINETLSFASQALVYVLERRNGIHPIFYSEMMKNIDGAWLFKKMEGIRTTFSQYLPHYEERLAFSSILLALITKVEGRTTLTQEEFQLITETSQGKLPLQGLIERFQNYLNRYVEKRELEVPPDFYSILSLLKRIQIDPSQNWKEGLAKGIDSIFQGLEELEAQKTMGALKLKRDLSSEPSPPPESQPARKKIFGAYAEVVDRVLENPPPSLSREELSALVSFVRLVPPAEALELTDRLAIYLGSGFEDLRVSLGLILYEKGFQEKGRAIVQQFLSHELFPKVLPLVLQVMGPEMVLELINQEHSHLIQARDSLQGAFQIWAFNQYLWDNPRWEAAAKALFHHPELLKPQSWQGLGGWIFNKGDVDSTLEEEKLLHLEGSSLERELHEYLGKEQALFETLFTLKNSPEINGGLKKRVEALWGDFKKRHRSAFEAYLAVMNQAEDFQPLYFIHDRSQVLKLFSLKELKEIFHSYPRQTREKALTLAEIYHPLPWSFPKALAQVTESLFQEVAEELKNEDLLFGHLELLQDLFDASIRKKEAQPQAAQKENPLHFRSILKELVKEEIVKEIAQSDADISPSSFVPVGLEKFIKKHFFHYFTISHSFDEEDLSKAIRLSWYDRAIQLDPERAPDYLMEGLKDLRNIAKKYSHKEDVYKLLTLDDLIAPFGIYLLHQALQQGLQTETNEYFYFLFREIPSLFPPEKPYIQSDYEDSRYGPLLKHNSDFLGSLTPIEWTFQMERERIKARDEGKIPEWFQRVREEIHRGGLTLTIKALSFYADRFIEENDLANLENIYRLMIQKGLTEPKRENIQSTFQEIQASPLTDATKDLLLEEFTEQLFNLIRGFRGMDLALIGQLQGLFPWKTPFMKAGDIPHYPKTEGLLIERLAEIPELVEPGEGKNNRVRLGAFSAAGLPLQRYAGWVEGLFEDPQGPQEIRSLKLRKNYTPLYRALDLPHPYTIPSEYASQQVETFLEQQGKKIDAILTGSDADQIDALHRLLFRILGSELRFLIREKPKGKISEVNLADSHMARFLLKWMKSKYAADERPPSLLKLLSLLFTAGPPEVRRLDVASAMLDWQLTREEKRRIFETATSDLIFSTRVRRRIVSLQQSPDESHELRYYRLILKIRYSRHPGHMISNYLLGKLEENPALLKEYESFFETYQAKNPLILSEVGLSLVEGEIAEAKDWMNLSNLERLDLYRRAISFLKKYMEVEPTLDYAFEGFINFKEITIREHLAEFSPYLKQQQQSEKDDFWAKIQANEFAEILSTSKWAEGVEECLEKMSEEGRASKRQKILSKFFEKLTHETLKTEGIYRDMILEDLSDRLEGERLPDFIQERPGLERDLLLWTLQSLDPVQKNLLSQDLLKATNDQERLLLMGRAAHLEKLLQLASIHPLVPLNHQKQFEIFQDEVPPRDAIDVEKTLSASFSGEDRKELTIDLNHPLKEGTIGGVYRGVFQGNEIVIKIIPEGKERDLRDSLRVVRGIQRYLWASRYEASGAITVDELLGFYERTLLEELDLNRELENAKDLESLLPKEFLIPTYWKEFPFSSLVVMEPLYSRRLRDISDLERAIVYRRIDEELIPAMLSHGIFHYDLHPGNIGLNEDGEIVLYDLGRVQKLSPQEQGQLMDFYKALQGKKISDLKTNLRRMGQVRDEAAFEKIDPLLEKLLTEKNPIQAIEKIYPQLADYGFQLHDNYVKFLFMFVTWEGTKKSLLNGK